MFSEGGIMEKKNPNLKKIMARLAIFSSLAILGPIIIFASGGYVVDRRLETYPRWTLMALIPAFILTNMILIAKKRSVSKEIAASVKKIAITNDDNKN